MKVSPRGSRRSRTRPRKNSSVKRSPPLARRSRPVGSTCSPACAARIPPKDRDRVKLDAEKVNGVSAHRLDISKDMDPQGRKMFGENATALVAFPSQAAGFAIGAEPAPASKGPFEAQETR